MCLGMKNVSNPKQVAPSAYSMLGGANPSLFAQLGDKNALQMLMNQPPPLPISSIYA